MSIKTKVVIGLGFGDEGKGITVDYLCHEALKHREYPLVVRFSGGHQAGHTVTLENGTSHVFSSFGSGTLRNIPTYWSDKCTVDPIALMNEYDALVAKGYTPHLYIDSNCPITTPYDQLANRLENEKKQHGSVGVGFGTTLKREEALYSLKAVDLNFPAILDIKLNQVYEYYTKDISRIQMPEKRGMFYELPSPELRTWALDMNKFNDAIKRLLSISTIHIVNGNTFHFHHYTDIIFEGSQGLMLDKNIGFYPNVTRSNVHSGVALEFINKHNLPIPEIYYVTRAYQTRHGKGPMIHRNFDKMQLHLINIENETNVWNPYQTDFKKEYLSVELLRYALERDLMYNDQRICNHLVITCLDQLTNEEGYIDTIEHGLLSPTELANKVHARFVSIYLNNSPCSKSFKQI